MVPTDERTLEVNLLSKGTPAGSRTRVRRKKAATPAAATNVGVPQSAMSASTEQPDTEGSEPSASDCGASGAPVGAAVKTVVAEAASNKHSEPKSRPVSPGPSNEATTTRSSTPTPVLFPSVAGAVQVGKFSDLNPYHCLEDPEDVNPPAPGGATFASVAAKLQDDGMQMLPAAEVGEAPPSLSKLSTKVKNEKDIKFLAYYSVDSREHLSVIFKDDNALATLSKREDAVFYPISESKCDNSAMAVSPKGRHVIISPGGKSIDIHDWPYNKDKSLYTQLPKTGFAFHVTATETYYLYSYTKDNQVHVACMDCMEGSSPTVAWARPTGMGQHRTMDAMERDDEIHCVLVSRHLDFKQQTKQAHTPVLTALNSTGTLWSISFKDLDSTATKFDLCCIDNDGRNFYVMNAQAKCVYVVSPTGQVLGQSLNQFQQPFRIAINQEAQKICLVNGFNCVVFFKISYKDK